MYEDKYIKDLQDGINEEEALKALNSQYKNLVINMLDILKYKTGNRIQPQHKVDMLADIDLIIYRTALRFDFSKKVKFITYLYNGIRFHFYNNYREITGQRFEDDVDNLYSHIKKIHSDIKSPDENFDISNLWNTLPKLLPDETERKFIEYRYLNGYSFPEISEKLNIKQKRLYTLNSIILSKLRLALKEKV